MSLKRDSPLLCLRNRAQARRPVSDEVGLTVPRRAVLMVPNGVGLTYGQESHDKYSRDLVVP